MQWNMNEIDDGVDWHQMTKEASHVLGMNLDWDYHIREGHGIFMGPRVIESISEQFTPTAKIHRYWNPLVNDSDAFDLAVKTGLCIIIVDGHVHVSRWYFETQGLTVHTRKTLLGDLAPVRQCILTAAAEIGRQLLNNPLYITA